MFSTFQGGPFVEVFTPQVSARPAARHRISSEPALGCRKARNIPWWRAPRAKGGNPRAPWIGHPRPDSPAPDRLDDLGTRAGATRARFLPAAIPTDPPASRPDARSTLPSADPASPPWLMFDQQGKDPTEGWKMLGGKCVKRMYEKGVKGYVHHVTGPPGLKMQLPADERRGRERPPAFPHVSRSSASPRLFVPAPARDREICRRT